MFYSARVGSELALAPFSRSVSPPNPRQVKAMNEERRGQDRVGEIPCEITFPYSSVKEIASQPWDAHHLTSVYPALCLQASCTTSLKPSLVYAVVREPNELLETKWIGHLKQIDIHSGGGGSRHFSGGAKSVLLSRFRKY